MIDRSYIVAEERGLDAGSIRRALIHEAGRALAHAQGIEAGQVSILRIEMPVEPLDPFHWLEAQTSETKIFWSGREDAAVTASLGKAHEVVGDAAGGTDGLDTLMERLAHAPAGARYYGGARFDGKDVSGAEWAAFGACRFVLPRFELNVQGEQATLAMHLVLPQDQDLWPQIQAEIKQLQFPAAPLAGNLPMPVSRADEPGRDGWVANVQWALQAFASGDLDKVVLARKVTFGFPERLEPLVLLKHLKAVTPGCYHFYFQPETGSAFLGASPERLYYRNGREILSEAVAGTRPRGRSTYDDDRLREELLHSEKDLREHAYVRRSIEEALRPLCDEVYADAHTSEMALARGRHLYSGIHGRLRTGASDAELLRALHPTPAVGGYPRQAAMEAIRNLEPFDRGWYAGLIGWIGADQADVAVAIRSGLVQDRNLSLFSGAGIVAGSIPESEHDEVEQKISDFVRVLGLDNGRA